MDFSEQEQGYAAFYSWGACPYRDGSVEAKLWNDGYDLAAQEEAEIPYGMDL